MKLEVGKTYDSRDGDLVHIEEYEHGHEYPYIGCSKEDGDRRTYTEDGIWAKCHTPAGEDLVRFHGESKVIELVLEAGKSYRDRGGRKREVIYDRGPDWHGQSRRFVSAGPDKDLASHGPDGKVWDTSCKCSEDLVAPWTDEPKPPPAPANSINAAFEACKAAVKKMCEPEDEIETNAAGGRHAALPCDFAKLPMRALLAVARCVKTNSKTHDRLEDTVPNWHKLTVREHLNHLLYHVCLWFIGDTQEPHLEHAACRALMAVEIELITRKG